jgi:molecular chaperone DnaK
MLADLRNDADGLAFTTARSLEEYRSLLAPADAARIADEVEQLKAAAEADDAERLAQAVRTLEKSALSIAAAMRAGVGSEGES